MILTLSRKTLWVVFAVSALSVQAQKKQLTAGQMLRNEPNTVVNPLPIITGWADDTHYIKAAAGGRRGGNGGGNTSVDVLTGAETPYTPPAAKGTTVSVHDKDIYIKMVDGTETRLTKTIDVEQNPTLSPDGTKVAFTLGGNLYLIDIASG